MRPTPEGELLLKRARDFVAEADEIASFFQSGRALRGRVRVELPVILARDIVIPRLPELLSRHPQLYVDIRASDRLSAALREGFDLVLRVGPVDEPGLVGRRLGAIPMMNGASPSYLRQHGTPRTLDELRSHFVVHYATDARPAFEYFDGETYEELPMRSLVTVDSFDAYEAAGVAGLGIVQTPRPSPERQASQLVEILPEFTARPTPVTLLHTHGRSAPRRVRAVMAWLAELLTPIVDGSVKPR